MKCPSCGKIIEDDSTFCYWCGETFSEPAVPDTAAEKRESGPSKEKRTPARQNAIKPEMNRTASLPDKSFERKTSVSGILIEIVSLLLLCCGTIGGIVVALSRGQTAIGLGVLAGSLIIGLFGFGFGRIICLLTSINAKIH